MSFIKLGKRSKLNYYIFGISTIGFVGSGISIYMRLRKQRLTLQKPYCQKAFRLFEGNEAMINLVGQPIAYQKPDISEKAAKLNDDFADLKVPFKGKNKSGLLHILADRLSIDDDWSINRLEATFKTRPDRLMIVYKRNDEKLQAKSKLENGSRQTET